MGLSKLKQLVDLKPSASRSSSSLLSVSRAKQTIKNHITKVFEQIPIYGEKKVHQQLLEDGVKVSLNTVARYRQELGLQAVLAVKQVGTTIPIKEHKKYSYKLQGLNISHANHVWSTDITYIKIAGGSY